MASVNVSDEQHYIIDSAADSERARRGARLLAQHVGFRIAATESVVLSVMELASNLLRYAPGGCITLRVVVGVAGMGVELDSLDRGPGITERDRALEDGYSTGGGLGSGLPAVRRLMDSFELSTSPAGTRIVARKWSS